jgi:hypothetical protein
MAAWIRILCFISALSIAAPGHARAVADSPEARTLLTNTAGEWYPGDRIRIVSPEPYDMRTAGWFSSLLGDSAIQVRMSRGEPPVTVGLYQIGALEEKVGSRRHVVTGMTVGLLVGLVAGVVYANDHGESEVVLPGFYGDQPLVLQTNGMKQTYIAIGAVSGLVLGGTIGFMAKTDRFGLVATFD